MKNGTKFLVTLGNPKKLGNYFLLLGFSRDFCDCKSIKQHVFFTLLDIQRNCLKCVYTCLIHKLADLTALGESITSNSLYIAHSRN